MYFPCDKLQSELPMDEDLTRYDTSSEELLGEMTRHQASSWRKVSVSLGVIVLIGSVGNLLRLGRQAKVQTIGRSLDFVRLASSQEYENFAWMWGDAGNMLFGHS